MLFTTDARRVKSIYKDLKVENPGFRLFCIGILACCSLMPAMGQLTARNTDGKTITNYTNAYGNRDTIFVFNQTPQAKQGNLSLLQAGTNTFKWYRFDYSAQDFEKAAFATETGTATSQGSLAQGGYKVTVTPQGATAPRDSFVAWLYMNPGFSYNLLKDDNGEVLYNYKSCSFTNFILRPNTVQSSFTYYNPARLQQGALTFNNRITYTMRRGSGSEVVTLLNTQGSIQYLRDNDPPYEDTRYYFRAYDMFGVEREDNIMYRTIIPYVTLNTPVLPDVDPASAPVPVRFTCRPGTIDLQTSEYVWRFGNGDSVVYNGDNPPPDTVKYTYYTPKSSGYLVTVMVTSQWKCTYTTPSVKIAVDDPQLEVANVFTPNGDNVNDYFKPLAISLRGFEISIYTRTGKRVYHYKGDDLRSWLGWDGRIENSGKDASEGVYFYVIKAAGWDEPSTQFNHKTERPPGPFGKSFHLYR
jgi:gliding motility-associated-like protein